MNRNGMFCALNYINNHIIISINCMLSSVMNDKCFSFSSFGNKTIGLI